MKTKIENWFKGNQNYHQGVALLIERIHKRQGVEKPSARRKQNQQRKLAWELCEIVKLDRSILTQVNTNVPDNRVSTAAGKRAGVTAKGPNEPIEPPIITAIKTKLAEFSKLRGQLHTEMAALGKSNDAAIMAKRQELIEKIDEINAEYDRLYEEKEKFFREKILPAENVLEKPKQEAPKGNAELTPVELMKRQNSLRSQISKAKDKLKKASKADKKEAQEKLTNLTSELAEIENLLSK
jgi:hypothetical protein